MRNRATGTAARTSMVRWLGGLLVALLALMGGTVAASATTSPSPSPSSSTSTTLPNSPEKITEGQICKYIGKSETCLPEIKTMLTTRVECSKNGMVVKIINGMPIKLPFKVDATVDGKSSTKLVWVAANTTLPIQLDMKEGASYKVNVEGLLGISWFYEGTRKCGDSSDDDENCVSGKVSVSCKNHVITVALNNSSKQEKTFTVVVKVGDKEVTDTVTIPAGSHDSKDFPFAQSSNGKKWSVHISAGSYDEWFKGTLNCETPKPPCVEPSDYNVYYDCDKKQLHLEFTNPDKKHELNLKVQMQHPTTGEWTPVLPWTIPAGQSAVKTFPVDCKNWKIKVWTDSGWKKIFTVDCSKCEMTSPSPTPSNSTSTPTPSDTPSETPSSSTPSTTPSPSDTPSSPEQPTPSDTPSSSAPAVPNNPGPDSPDTPSNPGGGLANTGSTGNMVIGSIAALLVIGGGATVFFMRRQRSS